MYISTPPSPEVENFQIKIYYRSLNISSIRIFDQIRDPEIPITLRPHTYIYRLSQNSTDKIGGVVEWTQTNILIFGTYGLHGVFIELRSFSSLSVTSPTSQLIL